MRRLVPACTVFVTIVALNDHCLGDDEQLEAKIRTWIIELDSNNFSVRRAAATALVKNGKIAIPQLVEATSATGESGYRAISILDQLASSSNEATSNAARDALEDLAKSSDPRVAGRATAALRKFQPETILQELGAQIRGDSVRIEQDWRGGDEGLVHLAALPPFRFLIIRKGPGITNAGMEHVGRLKKLRHLTITSVDIDDDGLAHLANLESLEILHLGIPRMTDAGLAHLQGLNRLTTIDLPEAVTDDGLRYLAKLPNLESISFSNANNLNGSGFSHLAGSNIRRLDLFTTGVLKENLAQLVHLPKLTSLTTPQNEVTDTALKYIGRCRQLERLTISNTRVTDEGLVHLQGLTNLKWLSLRENIVSDEGVRHLSPLTELETINVTATFVTSQGIESLRKSIPDLKLQDELTFEVPLNDEQQDAVMAIHRAGGKVQPPYTKGRGIRVSLGARWVGDDEGLIPLARLPNLVSVRVGPQITDAGMEHLKELTNLETLMLSGSKITDDGLKSLTKITNLRRLDLDDTNVTDVGVENLEALTNIETLSLSHCRITDACLLRLSEMTSLRSLALDGTMVSDIGIKDLRKLTNLRSLTLSQPPITEAGFSDLQKSLPNCHILRTLGR